MLQLETDQRKTELTAKRNQVRELAINVPGALARPEAGSDQSIEQTQANEWAAQLASSEVERAALNATIVVLKQTMQGEEVQIPENVLDEAVANDPEVQQLTFELQQDKIAMAGIREGSSLAAQHRKKIEDKERKLKEKETRLRDELRISARRATKPLEVRIRPIRSPNSRLISRLMKEWRRITTRNSTPTGRDSRAAVTKPWNSSLHSGT